MASVLLIVPKHDESRAVTQEFGIAQADPGQVIKQIGTIYYTDIISRSLAIAVLNRQTNTYSAALTTELISRENPRQIFLVGTALGRPDIPLGSVIIGERISDITERRQESAMSNGPVAGRIFEPDPNFIGSARRFIETFDSDAHLLAFYNSIGSEMDMENSKYRATKEQVQKFLPQIAVEPILSGNDYFMSPLTSDIDLPNHNPDRMPIWEQFRGYKAYDMEAVGFCLAAELRQVPWLVIRAISDHGNSETKGNRKYTTQAAAKLLRQFLESDITRIDKISSTKPRLSSILSRKLAGHFSGFMGYYDDNAKLVIYRETVKIERIGESLSAEVNSILIRGEAKNTLDYEVDIQLGDQYGFSGAWGSLESPQSKYFGSLAGHVSDNYGTVDGVWAGGHKEGVRIGRFVWYNRLVTNPNSEHIDKQLEEFQLLLERQINQLTIN